MMSNALRRSYMGRRIMTPYLNASSLSSLSSTHPMGFDSTTSQSQGSSNTTTRSFSFGCESKGGNSFDVIHESNITKSPSFSASSLPSHHDLGWRHFTSAISRRENAILKKSTNGLVFSELLRVGYFMDFNSALVGTSHEFRQTMQNVVLRSSSCPSSMMMTSPFSTRAGDASQEDQEEEKLGSNFQSSFSTPPALSGATTKKPNQNTLKHHPITEERTLASTLSSVPKTVFDSIVSASKTLASALASTPSVLFFYATNPVEFKKKLIEIKDAVVKEARHYWMGSKLLAADIRTARQILGRTLQGAPLTRRERKQLLRTVSDVFRVVPMSIFVLVPFMEFALPFALRLFPNMLPSTFQDELKAEENMKRELKARMAMAEFFQETLHDLAKEQKKKASDATSSSEEKDDSGIATLAEKREETAASFLDFIERAKKGEMFPADVIIKYSKYFQDDLTLDNLPRLQLINICRYMNIPPYGSDNLLRFQLRHRMRTILEDDQRILWEGIDSLNKMELREACQERGMRSTGLSKESYKRSLQQWLDLSVTQSVPISLLIMSRTFFLQKEMTSREPADADGSKSLAGLADAMSGLEKVVNEVALEVASNEEKASDPEVTKIKLEILELQNDLIKEERKEKEREEKKKKEELEKAKAEEFEADVLESTQEDLSETQLESFDQQEDVQTKPVIEVKIQDSSEVIDKESKDLPVVSEADRKPDEEDGEEGQGLSAEEMEAISQLVSPDPVHSEREELERIKAAMHEEETSIEEEEEEEEEEKEEVVGEEIKESSSDEPLAPTVEIVQEEPVSKEEADIEAAKVIAESDAVAKAEAISATKISHEDLVVEEDESTLSDEEASVKEEAPSSEDVRLDKAVSRLKSRVQSMVGKIENQLDDVEKKISDKLHFLDKDHDGLISREEMVQVLMRVLKRNLTFEEAMSIAGEMDENDDGFFSVAELSQWVDKNKLVKLVENGREDEVDRLIIARHGSKKREGSDEESTDVAATTKNKE